MAISDMNLLLGQQLEPHCSTLFFRRVGIFASRPIARLHRMERLIETVVCLTETGSTDGRAAISTVGLDTRMASPLQ
jgi:hypothetical protein